MQGLLRKYLVWYFSFSSSFKFALGKVNFSSWFHVFCPASLNHFFFVNHFSKTWFCSKPPYGHSGFSLCRFGDFLLPGMVYCWQIETRNIVCVPSKPPHLLSPSKSQITMCPSEENPQSVCVVAQYTNFQDIWTKEKGKIMLWALSKHSSKQTSQLSLPQISKWAKYWIICTAVFPELLKHFYSYFVIGIKFSKQN